MSLSIHEYQSKEIFRKYGIPLNDSIPASNPEEAFRAAQELLKRKPGFDMAIKAQVHAGGRGKGGGIKIVKTAEEVREISKTLFGKRLITPQTGPEGKPVSILLIEATSPIAKEFYTSIILDRSAELPCLILSEAGGMNIEEVAQKTPDKIVKKHFSLETGLSSADAQAVANKFIQDASQAQVFAKTLEAMAKIFLDLDCELVEVNPLALMKNGTVIAIDAKINFDENALFRHPDMAAYRDPSQEDPREVEAKKFDLSYVGLDGNIGCIVNGAGLAMATMDIIKYAGGDPANFLDVGGGASKEKVTAAFKIILQDPKVKAILVNIFGGIMRCDVVAEGILAAVDEVGVNVPIVVRLEGTNVKEGKEILKKSSLNIIAAANFKEAAEKVVAATKTKS